MAPTSHWQGFESIRYLFIFGDSLSAVYRDYSPMLAGSLPATEENPLGVPWPGAGWAEGREPTWPAYLVESTQKQKKIPPLLVYDYAIGGDTVDQVMVQIEGSFIPRAGLQVSGVEWQSEDTLFVTWVGTNDCGTMIGENDEQAAITRSIQRLFSSLDEVYNAGGRNFLFIDVPPVNRAPGLSADPRFAARLAPLYTAWNETLSSFVDAFESTHPSSTCFVYSTYDLFTRILNAPGKYGFKEEDRSKSGGEIWADYLHPTSKVHKILAEELEKFLRAMKA